MSDLLGVSVRKSSEIAKHIKATVDEVMQQSQQITGVKPADPSRATEAQNMIDRIGENRGRPLFFPYVGSGLGNGPFVELEDGSVKLDLINGIGVHALGHSHPEIIEAQLRGSLSDVVYQGNLQPNTEYLKMSDALLKVGKRNSRFEHVWITTCGSRANEIALKICRQKKSPARMIISMENAFAGRTTMTAEISDNPGLKQGLPEYNEVLRVPFFDKDDPSSTEKSLEILKSHIDKHGDNIAMFIAELMQGEGGYKVAPASYWQALLGCCKENGIPVVADEIQTFGRTGEFFAFQKLGLGDYVDVCTLAKSAQCAAVLYTKEMNPKPGLVSGTFAGSSAGLNAGVAIIEHLDSGGYMGPTGKIEQINKKFIGMLNELNDTTCKGLLKDASGMGTMIGVTPLDGSREKMIALVKTLYDNGLMCFGCGRGPFRIRFLIPAILEDAHLDVAKAILEKSILEHA